MIFEAAGKVSFTRVSGLLALIALLGIFVHAGIQKDWETVRALGSDLALLTAGLYGINKWTTAWENRK